MLFHLVNAPIWVMWFGASGVLGWVVLETVVWRLSKPSYQGSLREWFRERRDRAVPMVGSIAVMFAVLVVVQFL